MYLSPETIDILMKMDAPAEQKAELLKSMQRDSLAMVSAPPGVNEERERIRNASTYAERKRAKDRERQRLHRERKRAERDGHGDLCDSHAEVTAASRDVTATVKDRHGDVTPLAGVRDITPNSENNHNYTLPSASAISDDWPPGKASDHAKLICAEMASPWLDPNKAAGLVTTAGRLAAWKLAGASWEHDVLPLIRGRLMNRRSPVTTWGFFDTAIAETVAANREALRIPEAGQVVPIRPGTGPPMSLTDQIGANNQQSYALAMKMLENGSNR